MTRSARARLAVALTSLAMSLTITSQVPAQDLDPGYRPTFHPDALKGPPAGALNEVLVLGTLHLSGLEDSFQPAILTPLLDRLAGWRPTAIATESLSGLQCDNLRRFPSRYAATVESYCWDPAAAGVAMGLNVPTASAEAERLLAQWPVEPSAAERRHLAGVFLAAGERGSALVQWLRLPPDERVARDGLDPSLATLLNELASRRNEIYLLAAPLAARLGLERLWSMDDHTADSPEPTDPAEAQAFADAITKAWDNPATHTRRAQLERLAAGLSAPGGVLEAYRAYNAPEAQQATYGSDFGAALTEPSPQGFGRGYVGYWETRNLRMAANIRDVLGRYPGTRMLVIVGASHKGYLEAYLDQMHDARLTDAEALLR